MFADPNATGVKAVEYIRNFAASWAKAKPPTKATMIRSVFERSSFEARIS